MKMVFLPHVVAAGTRARSTAPRNGQMVFCKAKSMPDASYGTVPAWIAIPTQENAFGGQIPELHGTNETFQILRSLNGSYSTQHGSERRPVRSAIQINTAARATSSPVFCVAHAVVA